MPSRPTLRRLLVATAATAFAAVTVLGSAAQATHPPQPASITVGSITSAIQPPEGTPDGAVPYVLVKAGDQFSIHVSFKSRSGAPAAFTRNTTLTIATNTGAGNKPVPATGIALAGQTTAVLTTTLALPANQVRVTVSASGSGVTPGTSSPAQAFDVLSELRVAPSTPNFRQGIGGSGDCTEATPENPVCGVVILPNGATSTQVLLSLGACDLVYAACDPRGAVVQTLAGLSGLYTNTSPATILMRCDKTLCGSKGVPKTYLMYSLQGNAPLTQAPACPKKSTIGSTQAVCVDYVQSQRDNAGDTMLFLLFTRDARVSVR
jgi:hypothetical protein